MSDKLTKFSQERSLSVLCFDDQNCILVRDILSNDLLDEPYRTVAIKAIDYINQYGQAPKEYLPDLLEDKLIDPKEGPVYRDLIQLLYSSKENLNSQYVIDGLKEFVKEKTFENAFIKAAPFIQKHDIAKAQEILDEAKSLDVSLFDPGIKITDLSLLTESLEEEDVFPTGIEVLDKMGVGPARQQMYIFMSRLNGGKSWHMMQLGKMAALDGRKVAHITLELQSKFVQQRYIQSILGISRWHIENLTAPIFSRDGNGQLIGSEYIDIDVRCLEDPDIIEYIRNKIARLKPILDSNIRVKYFPRGAMTLQMLEGYLDGLERIENFIPDLVIIDHLAHMKLSVEDYRLRFGRLVVELGGLAGTRNFALVSAHQINREGIKSKNAGIEHVAEDISLLMNCDVGIIQNQTKMEEKLRLARLTVARARSMQTGFSMLITQGFATGQYCLDSAYIPEDYSSKSPFTDSISLELGDE